VPPMAASTRQPRRGPKPNPNRGTPSGYRIDARARFEMQMAASFVGTQTLQDTIAVAVQEFLARMHAVPGFSEALRNAEENQQRRGGIPSIVERADELPAETEIS
jgi:hypothetical protein